MTDNHTALPRGFRLHGNNRDYKIEKMLGQGGFGITYHATGPVQVGTIVMQVDFCLKEFFLSNDCERLDDSSISYSNPARTRVENSRKDFIAEAQRLKKIGCRHPNIVGFDEVFEANNTAYYVMEYISGSSLDKYVADHGALSEQETLRLMRPILDAVRLLHQNRICHLDIKPANIMLSTDAEGGVRPVLIDFGLSKHYDSHGHATSTINSFGYSEGYAPVEQYKGITTFSPGADLYALGATLWHCLTAIDPPSALDVRDGELASRLPESVSDEMRTMIDVMTRDQRTRPTSLDEVERLTAEILAAEQKAEQASADNKATVVRDVPQTPPVPPVRKREDKGVVLPPTPPTKPVTEPLGKSKSRRARTVIIAVIASIVGLLLIFGVLVVIGSDSNSQTEEPTTDVDTISDIDVPEQEFVLTDEATDSMVEQEPISESNAPAKTSNSGGKKPQSASSVQSTTNNTPKPANNTPKPAKTTSQDKERTRNSTSPYTIDF